MVAEKNDISSVEYFKSICKRHCDIIETCFLDYEKYGIKDLLSNIANSINQIKLAAKNTKIGNAVLLAAAMSNAVNYAIEGKISLSIKDIDSFLKANDLFYSLKQFNSNEILDLFENESVIIEDHLKSLKNLVSPYRTKKTNYNSVLANIEETLEMDNRTILLEKFKNDLVKSTATIDLSLQVVPRERKTIDVVPISLALDTIKGSAIGAGVTKAFDLADRMHDFILALAENHIPVNNYQMDVLVKCNKLFQDIARTSAVALIDKFMEYSDYIDNYSNFLNDFLTDRDVTVPTLSAKFSDSADLTDGDSNQRLFKQEEKLLFFGYKSDKSSDDQKYNQLLDSTVNIISNLSRLKNSITSVKQLKNNLRSLELAGNSILYNIANTEKITQIVFDINKKLEHVIDKLDAATESIDSSSVQIKNRIDNIYSNLFDLRSVAFGDILLSFNDLAEDLASLNKKKVKLKFVGRFLRIGVELSPLLEVVLPRILRYIIVTNIEPEDIRLELGKQSAAEIVITAYISSGKLIIKFFDDGSGKEYKMQENDLADIFGLINKNNGKIQVESRHLSFSKYTLSFDMKYVIIKCLLFSVAGTQYALQKSDSDGLIFIEEYNLYKYQNLKIIELNKILGVQTSQIAPTTKPAVIINDSNTDYAVLFDKFLGEAELLVEPTNGYFKDNPLVNSTSIINDAPVVIIDKSKLLEIIG